MVLAVVWFAVGILLVVKGSDVFIDAAGWLSDVTAISRVVIGATVVSLATTSPEYVVSLIAAMKGYTDLSVGNAVGTLSCNIGIAFALLAMAAPGKVGDRLFGVKGFVMIIAAALLMLFCLDGRLSVAESAILVLVFVGFTFVNIRFSNETNSRRRATNAGEAALNIAKFIGGAAAIVGGSNLIVDNGKFIAGYMGVSDALIGLTFIAIGTSLPEIVTCIAAIIKKESALSIGNIIGANVLDTTLILASCAFLTDGVAVSSNTIAIDLPVTLLLMLITVLPTAISQKLYRWQGLLLVGVYVPYLIWLCMAEL